MQKIKKTISSISSVRHVVGICQGLYAYLLLFVAKRVKSPTLIEKKHNIIRDYIKRNYSDITTSTNLSESIIPHKTLDKRHNVWVFWYQGKENMPHVVKRCYERLCTKNISNDCEIHLISKYNLDEYLTFPEYIIQKVESGTITITHFSDVLRYALLYHYSGFWIDATVWCEQQIPVSIFKSKYWTIRLPRPQYTISVSYKKWSTFILWYRDIHDPLAKHMLNLFMAYWQREDSLVDYLLVDYLLEYSIDSQREGKEFLSIAESNHHLYHLMQKMKNNFVPQEWNEMKSDTKFFKLSYKGHDVQAAMDNPRSYYNIVISSK